MDRHLPKWLEDSGVHGYGYVGEERNQVGYDTWDFPLPADDTPTEPNNPIIDAQPMTPAQPVTLRARYRRYVRSTDGWLSIVLAAAIVFSALIIFIVVSALVGI